MSRIGKAPVALPKGVTFTHSGQSLTVKGPKGELKQAIEPGFKFKLDAETVVIERPTEQKRHRALHGLYRALVNNMAKGVSEGYKLEMELVGVGYRAEVKGQIVEFALGFSHAVHFILPAEVKATTVVEKGQNPKLIITGIDNQLLGQIAAKMRTLRAPEPYKGKGIRFVGEQVRRKAGKSAGKGKK
jgi:large subunit ribosomal protein L6